MRLLRQFLHPTFLQYHHNCECVFARAMSRCPKPGHQLSHMLYSSVSQTLLSVGPHMGGNAVGLAGNSSNSLRTT